MDCRAPRLLCPWHSPGKNTGVGCHGPSLILLLKSNGTREDTGLLYSQSRWGTQPLHPQEDRRLAFLENGWAHHWGSLQRARGSLPMTAPTLGEGGLRSRTTPPPWDLQLQAFCSELRTLWDLPELSLRDSQPRGQALRVFTLKSSWNLHPAWECAVSSF